MATINGGVGDDDLEGTSGADNLTGSSGADVIEGAGGDDVIVGDGAPGGGTGTIGQFYYEFFNIGQSINALSQIPNSNPDATGYVGNTDVDALAALHGDNPEGGGFRQFGIRWYGTIEVPTGGGTYTFSTTSDDGSSLSINGTQVVDNDGTHGVRTRSGSITLTEGTHNIEFDFFENGGGESMAVSVSGTGIGGTVDLFSSGLVGDPDDNTTLSGPSAEGNDTLIGGEGNDTISGNGGDDQLFGDAQSGVPGLQYEFYNVNNLSSVSQIPTSGAASTGFVETINIDALAADHATNFSGSNPNQFALRYTGEITIETGDTYTFFLNSDDGAQLFIDGNLAVDHDGLHSASEVSDTVVLAPGTYSIEILYFERNGQQALDLSVSGADTGNVKTELLASGIVSSEAPVAPTPGDDTLDGGEGSDTFTGGAGLDTFEGFGGGAGVNDTITDFEGESAPDTPVDIVDLSPFFTRWTIAQDNFAQVGSDVVVTLPDGATVTLNNITIDTLTTDNTLVPCFTPGTRIATPTGHRDIDQLAVGDLVCTMDHGLQPIRWIGRKTITGARMVALHQFRPILIRKGAFGMGLPTRDLRVSPQHRFLVRQAAADLMFGSQEVLVTAKALVNNDTILVDRSCNGTTYIHLLFDRHEVIFAEGQPTESFHPGEHSLNALDDAVREELLALFPQLGNLPQKGGLVAARPSLKSAEVRLLPMSGAASARQPG